MSKITMFQKKDRYELGFAILYFLEQVALIVLTFRYPDMITLFVSIFPVVFLTTIAVEKICLKVNYEETIEEYKKASEKTNKFHFGGDI